MKNSVLIVEDEALVALEIRENVERLGHSVVDVTDTAEGAVKLALSKKPDLILMDVRLKGEMDGVEAASLIHKSADMPIIFLTAYSGDEILKRATITEPYGYLLKPVEEQQLATAIRVATHKHRKDTVRRVGARGLTSILKALPNGIVVSDTGMRVRYLNKKAEELTGYSTKDASGCPLRVVLQGAGFEEASLSGFDEVLSDGKSILVGERQIVSKSGEEFPGQIDVSPLRDREGIINGLLVNIMDMRVPVKNLQHVREDALTGGGSDPIIREMGDVRSYLEVEIVRLVMNEEIPDAATRFFREGQIAAYKRILSLMFGSEALESIEAILPN